MLNHTSPSVTTDPRPAFRAFQDFVAEFDPIDLLSQLTLTFLFAPETEFIGEASPVETLGKMSIHPMPPRSCEPGYGIVSARLANSGL